MSLKESIQEIVDKIQEYGFTDFSNPRYYNIEWMKLLEETAEVVAFTGSVFGTSKPPIGVAA